MKKILSLSTLFVMLAMGACTTSPNLTTGQQIAKNLEGEWADSTATFIFSGNTVKINTDTTITLTLANSDSLVLGNKTYAVYSGGPIPPNGDTVAIFRAEGDSLFGFTGMSLEEIKQEFTTRPNNFNSPTADRKKS